MTAGNQLRELKAMRSNCGFTLMELMITVAVIAVLASIAYPSYRDQILKSHRTDGKAALMQAAQTMERCFTRTNTFVGCVTFPTNVPGGRYQITDGGTTNPTTASAYWLNAVPQGAQTSDTRCGTLTLQQDGMKAESGTATNLSDCW
jgi:type IV pilus assembly protein PilE